MISISPHHRKTPINLTTGLDDTAFFCDEYLNISRSIRRVFSFARDTEVQRLSWSRLCSKLNLHSPRRNPGTTKLPVPPSHGHINHLINTKTQWGDLFRWIDRLKHHSGYTVHLRENLLKRLFHARYCSFIKPTMYIVQMLSKRLGLDLLQP